MEGVFTDASAYKTSQVPVQQQFDQIHIESAHGPLKSATEVCSQIHVKPPN